MDINKRNEREVISEYDPEWGKWVSEDDIAHRSRNKKNDRKLKRSKPRRSREYD